MNPNRVKVRFGIPEDIPFIVDLNTQWQKKALDNNLSNGFVSGQIEYGYLMEVIAREEIVVCVAEDKVIGYYMVNDIPHSPTNYKKWKEMVREGFLSPKARVALAAQSAILLEYHGQGLAIAMLRKIETKLKNNYDIIITSINRQNQKNLNRHKGNSGWHIYDVDDEQVYIFYDLHLKKNRRFFLDSPIRRETKEI